MSDAKVTDVTNKTFDYVIAGGGTAGLTLAARLSEDPSVSVLVLEAGRPNLDDPTILVPGYGAQYGDPNYDWAFSTVKQPHSNDRVFFWSRGKSLGGTSAMNLHEWIKPPAADVNAIERLGNPGWGWESFLKYSKRSETFQAPADDQNASLPLAFSKKNRGTTGPIQTSLPFLAQSPESPFLTCLRKMGVKSNEDPYGGDNTGAWIGSTAIDSKTLDRSYAATGYYQPNKDRPNLTVLTEATVVKALFADRRSSHENLTATGVEFRLGSEDSHAYVAHARKEVILSAGTIKSPQILELSGIGRKDILDRLGINVNINLPGVGENMQEHYAFHINFELKDDVTLQTVTIKHDPESAADQSKQRTERKGALFSYIPLSVANPNGTVALVAKAEKAIEEQKASGHLPAGLAEQYDLQLEALKNGILPDIEVVSILERYPITPPPHPERQHVGMVAVLNHPLSRGTIHSVSQDPMQQPEIDPHYLENDFDLEILVQHFKFSMAVAQLEPLKSMIDCEEDPKAKCTTDDEIREYIKNTGGTLWHTVGSCSMMPRDKQGVVDPELKVYGTQNLRVVDISIIPLHMASHTQAVAYAIGEKAADIIRGTH